jgi:hypothetical protein
MSPSIVMSGNLADVAFLVSIGAILGVVLRWDSDGEPLGGKPLRSA